MSINSLSRIIIFVLTFALTMFLPIGQSIAQDNPAEREIEPGKMYDTIGTFDGWSFWVGYGASFSESYNPDSESYGWIVHFAPEGMYVSLQGGEAIYSGVDVNAGFDYFYGITYSPDGDTISTKYLGDLSGMTFSVSDFSASAMPTGPAANLSMGISSSTTFYKIGKGGPIARAIQYGTGFSISYALVSIPLPLNVSLGTKSWVEAGFYPIASWNIYETGDNPQDAILYGLDQVRSSKGTGFDDLNLVGFADPIHNMINNLPVKSHIDEFINSKTGDSAIDDLIREVDQWKETGETKDLPESLKPQILPSDMYTVMKPIQSATTCAFEVGYYYGDKSDNIYCDCLKEINAKRGEPVKITVTTEEIAECVPDSSPSDFDGVTIVFDIAPENYLGSQKTEVAKKIEDGKAEYEFTHNALAPVILGVRIDRCDATGNRRVELCRRWIIFEE